ncbi:MAG: hypothetical protein ACI4EM_07315 [Hominisplanchenecus sp.]|nr:hypothetical protein [Lachnospiraceae bacterium]
MNINPMKLMQMRNAWSQFMVRHPKLPGYFQAVSQKALQEGTVMEISIKTPDGETLASNIRLTAEDIALMAETKEMFGENMR